MEEPEALTEPSVQQQEARTHSSEPYAQEAAVGEPSRDPEDSQLQDIPEATMRWRAQRALMLAWFLASLVTLLMSSLSPFLGTTAGLAGITGSSWYFCHCCGVKQAKDIASNIRVSLRTLFLARQLPAHHRLACIS